MQIGEQALSLRQSVGGDDEKSRGKPPRESGDECRVGGARKTRDTKLLRGSGQGIEYARKRREAFKCVEQTG